jgi:ArsR family transcriptional regulator, virulence genes transcriptional regulator
MPSEQFNFNKMAQVLSVLANPTRIKIMAILNGGQPVCARELAERTGLSSSGLSQHMAKLRQVDLISSRKDAQVTIYRCSSGLGATLLSVLEEMIDDRDRFPKRLEDQ